MARTRYIWDPVNDTYLMEKDAVGNTMAVYTNEPGEYGSLISQHREGETSYYHFDGQCSTRELTDGNQTKTDTYTYTALGETVATTGATTNPFGYKGALGYYVSPATDDVYVRARTYHPRIARWDARDGAWPVDGLNAYLYAKNNPVKLADPTGRLSIEPLRPQRLGDYSCKGADEKWVGIFWNFRLNRVRLADNGL